MGKFKKTVQMMDAGTALFTSKENFGRTIGQVKAEMEVYGKVYKAAELTDGDLPESTAGCDLFLDFSTFWRIRYISCLVEDAGEVEGAVADGEGKTARRYAAVFKEGNKSTVLRGIVFALIVIRCLLWAFDTGCGPLRFLSIPLALIFLYLWIVPSRKSRETLFAIKERLSKFTL